MGSFVFNIAKGKAAYLAGLPAANDALVAIPIEASGVESDAALVDYATVAALLAGPTNEQTTMGRKTLTGVSVTVDNANDRVAVDSADLVWAGATGNPISDILICYDPDTTGGTDADLVPISWHDFAATPDGTDITATVADFYRAA
ncbi:hypothetical protein GCM10018962_77150 [Dactylosporangium matsuzakiense]|uniref:hypothetical protein n=1 Tax=Dactylosporangium matsuzakiense TaxID=53360 RepID=UPI0031F07612